MRAKMLNESIEQVYTTIWDKYGENLPEIFKKTIYRMPSTSELSNINSFELNANEIIQGLTYTIVGRGMKNAESKNKIFTSISNLSKMYPDNNEYKKALLKLAETGIK